MPTIDIPGIGPVEFPDSMAPADITSAAKRLHQGANQTTAKADDFAPAPRAFSMADYLTGADRGPSVAGFGKNLARGAVDTVRNLPESVPRLVKGLTRLTPESIGKGIEARVGEYAHDPAGTIYDDPLSFLGDAATVLEAGGALRGPMSAGAGATRRGASAAAKALAPAADIGMAAATGAAENAFIVGPMAKGAYRGVKSRLAARAAEDAAKGTLTRTEALEQAMSEAMDLEARHAAAKPRLPVAAAEPEIALRDALVTQAELPEPAVRGLRSGGPSAAEKFRLEQAVERELAQGRRSAATQRIARSLDAGGPTRYPDAWQPFMQR